MHTATKDLQAVVDEDGIVVRGTEWGDLHVEHMLVATPVDMGPLLQGLPDDLCQCPHWGYIIRGSMRVRYPDREEVIDAGAVYYLPPGHSPVIAAGTELVEFSPQGPYQLTMDVATRNFLATQGAGASAG
jgi:hypothetical protein